MAHAPRIPDGREEEKHLRSRLLDGVPGLRHGFTLRRAGDFRWEAAAKGLTAEHGAHRLRLLRQVHGTGVVPADDPRPRPPGDAWAGRPGPGILLGILTADCLPVLLFHPPSGRLGLAHAGWRGAAGGVVGAVLRALEVPTGELLAALGPAIGPCCYQVGPEVARAVGPSPHLAPWEGSRDRHRLDLRGLVGTRLLEAGVRAERVDAVGGCTRCDSGRFFSHRRAGEPERMCAFLGWAAT